MREAATQPSAARSFQCVERRAAVRYVTTMEASYHPVLVETLGPCCPARIWDLSLGGMAVVVRHRYEPGTVIGVVPERLPPGRYPALEARVVHAAPHADGLWLIGCEFLVPLSEEEFELVLG